MPTPAITLGAINLEADDPAALADHHRADRGHDRFMTHLAMWEGDDATWGDRAAATTGATR